MCKGSPLMPGLRELLTYNIPVSETSILVAFISPTLRVLDISFELEEEEDSSVAPHVVGSLLHTLPLLAPDLEELTFEVDFSLSRRPNTLSYGYLESFVLYFTKLKTLSIRCAIPLDKKVLQLLSSIPTLQDLSCTIDFRISHTLAAGPRCTFQQLTDLHVSGYLDHLAAFCYVSQFPSLASVTLQVTGTSVTRGPEGSFAAICERCNPASLTPFSIESLHPFFSNVLRPSSVMQYAKPLLAFPNITSFHFYCFYIVPPVHDDDLVQLGGAWPRLESFRVSHLVGEYSLPGVSRPTLSGLIELARRCPRLDAFHIPELDVTVIPEKNAAPCTGHGARHFTVKNVMPELPSKTYMQVATVLDRVFPDIDLEYAWSVSEFDGQEWKGILQFLEAMRVGRENSELRAKLREG